jgi:hypothetical protein
MIQPENPGESANFGGEVTGKRPSPLPLMTVYDILSIMNSVYLG